VVVVHVFMLISRRLLHSSSPPMPKTSSHICSLLCCVDIHYLSRRCDVLVLELRDCDVLADLLLGDDLLVEHRGSALGEPVVALLRLPCVRCDVVAHEGGLLFGDDGHIDVASGAQVVPDTGLDGVGAQLDGLVARQVGLPLCLEDGHGGQRAGAHGHVGQLVGGAVGVDGEEVGARGVDARDDQVGADVALVAEQVLLQHGHGGHDARLAAGAEGVQLEVRRDDGGGELGVGGGTGTRAPDVRGDVVQLLAVLWRLAYKNSRVCSLEATEARSCGLVQLKAMDATHLVSYNRPAGGSCVCSNHDAAIEQRAHDCGSCAGRLWQRHTLGVEGSIAVVVGEVEAGHDGGIW
jgi:hypothetical protein